MVEQFSANGVHWRDVVNSPLFRRETARNILFFQDDSQVSQDDEKQALGELSEFPALDAQSTLITDALGGKNGLEQVRVLRVPVDCPTLTYEKREIKESETYLVDAWDNYFPQNVMTIPIIADNLDAAKFIGKRVASYILRTAGRRFVTTNTRHVLREEFVEACKQVLSEKKTLNRRIMAMEELRDYSDNSERV